MSYEKLVEDILIALQKKLRNKESQKRYLADNSSAFTRKRNLPFEKLTAFLFQRSTYSLDIKLEQWFQAWMPHQSEPISRQAISKARQKLPAEIFHDALILSSQMFQKNKKRKDWNGFQIYAVDGTDLQIPTTKETLEEFGAMKSRFGCSIAGASASALYDVMNDIILDSVICPYKTDERVMAEQLLDTVMTEESKKESIVLFDRGYPSYRFLGYLFDQKIYFVMRIKEQMSHLRDPRGKDGEVYRKCGGKCRTLRTICVKLEEEKEEFLITNIPREKISLNQFKELYFLRWGIEGKYGEWKSLLEIENFSGKKSICIKQDFYISLFLSNICSLMKQAADKRYHGITESGKEYQARRSYLIHEINRQISGILLKQKTEEIRMILEDILKRSKKKRSQIRRNRKCERNLNLNRRKYSMNHKSCI